MYMLYTVSLWYTGRKGSLSQISIYYALFMNFYA